MGSSPQRLHPAPPAAALPHDEPARFVESVIERDADGILCRARIPAASPWAGGGAAPATAGLEIAAQAAAWMEALERAEEGRDAERAGEAATARRVGYLVRIRDATLGAAIPAGAAVIARVRRSGGAPPLAIYEVEVTLAGGSEPGGEAAALVCRATLGTYLTDETVG